MTIMINTRVMTGRIMQRNTRKIFASTFTITKSVKFSRLSQLSVPKCGLGQPTVWIIVKHEGQDFREHLWPEIAIARNFKVRA